MTQEEKNHLMVTAAEMGEMLDSLNGLVSNKTLQTLAEALCLFGEEISPLWEEVIEHENKQTKLNL